MSREQPIDPRVLVLQLGARLHYAVPAAYARAKALHRFYTDACASLGVLSIARERIPSRYRTGTMRRLLGRTLPSEVPRELVRVATFSTLLERLKLPEAGEHPAVASTHERLRQRILRRRFEGANCFYSVDNGDFDLMKAARDAGLAVVFEQVSCPSIGRIVKEERGLFPGIEKEKSDEIIEGGIERDIQVFRLANVVTCPSDHVRQDIISLAGSSVRTALIPYGINQEWLQTPCTPVPGRILFVGKVCLLKGSHYLAEATRLLKARGVPCDVRVVGHYEPSVVKHPAFQGPTYVGLVPRATVRSEFAQADVLAFPTLAEGLAMVQLEAMACGVPVVTTARCGVRMRDGEDGFTVPFRDARALADRLEQIISDRELRERMSRSVKQRAQELNWSHFGELLLTATRTAIRDDTRARQVS